jgi:Flp pilus assembly protein TadG
MRLRRGVAIVEFAAGSGLLLAIFSGTFDLGYTLIQYNRLETAAAQAARYASMVPYDSPTTTPSAAFLSSVRKMALYGNPAGGHSAVTGGLTEANVELKVTFANGVPASMQVSITGYKIYALFGTHPLTGKPRASYPYQGVWAPA